MIGAASRKRARIRRPAERVREEILDVAERRLVADRHDAVRVLAVARDIGVTDAAVLYHFGSHDALLQAVTRRAARRLGDDVAEGWRRWASAPDDWFAVLHGETLCQVPVSGGLSAQ